MQRTDWNFQYRASQIAEATRSKIDDHQARLTFWKANREAVLATIRLEGIEVDEKIVLAFQSSKARDWDRDGQVVIRNDLQKAVQEIYDKLRDHPEELSEFKAWKQVLLAHPEAPLPLDIQDWLHFFGRH
jgi:hypothetical protein